MSGSVRWLGHATVLIELAGVSILTDPVLRSRIAHLRRRIPISNDDIPANVDAVLISHLHLDHLDLPTLQRLGEHCQVCVPRGAGRWLRRRGFRNVVELAIGDEHRVGNVAVTAVPAYHSGWRPPFGPRASAVGYVLTADASVYFAGDTGLFEGMSSLAGDLDAALLPIWGWGRTIGTSHLNPVSAAEATRRLRPRIAIPIHWGTYHPIGSTFRGLDFLIEPPKRFIRAAQRIAPETDVRILAPGESTSI